MARLDRLAPVKEVAQVGAVHRPRVLARAARRGRAGRSEPELRAALAQLVDSELVFRRGTPPKAVYTFKHALVQDAAYASLLRAAASSCTARSPPSWRSASRSGGGQPELLARHYAEAGLAARAVDYWRKAGRRAAERRRTRRRSAFKRGLELLDALPDGDARAEELDLQLALGAAVRAAGWFTAAEAKPVYGRAIELAERLGHVRSWSMPSAGCGGSPTSRASWHRGRKLVDRADAAVRRTSDWSP